MYHFSITKRNDINTSHFQIIEKMNSMVDLKPHCMKICRGCMCIISQLQREMI
jgi:hypothetical protein